MEELQQLIDLTEKGLTQIATQLGTTLPQLWEIMIKQQYVEAIQRFFAFIVVLIVWTIIYKKRSYIKELLRKDEDSYDNFEKIMPMVIVGISLLVFTIISLAEMTTGIGQLINPEYYAIRDIVNQIGNLTNK